jgi:hypothetical protein
VLRPLALALPVLIALSACKTDVAAPSGDVPSADGGADVSSTDVTTAVDVTNATDVTARPDVPVIADAPTARDAGTATDAAGPLDVVAARDVLDDVPARVDDVPARPDAVGAGCGTRGTGPCPEGLFCNFPRSATCGVSDAPGVCAPIPTACADIFLPVCGCDGRSYGNACEAASQQVSVAADGPCRSADAGADVATDASASCGAQEAVASGACARFFGYAWNGAACVSLSGCSCAGAACTALFETPDACRAAYTRCDCRSVGCGDGRNCQACRGPNGLVYACIPNGAAC